MPRLLLCFVGFLVSLALCRAEPGTKHTPFWAGKPWAQYSPYAPAGSYKSPPQGCSIEQVNLIQRHGARYPTTSARKEYLTSLAKLESTPHYDDPRLNFLKNYTVKLGTDDLIVFGATESFAAGFETYKRYPQLVRSLNLPFVRASGSDRVIQSSLNWTAGFSVSSGGHFSPSLGPIISEDSNSNNTLDDNMCPNAGDGDDEQTEWLTTAFTPLVNRLNTAAPGANLTAQDVYNIMALCPFDSLAHVKLSPLCQLFDDREFELFEYANDVDKYYGTGYGEKLGPVQGVGYINELIARLTGQPVQDETQTNRTLDSSPVTFPLNRTIYADFSHDNQMVAIYSALGLFRQQEPLSTTNPDPKRTWRISRMTPFAGRMVTEKLKCARGDFVRIFVDDALQPLDFCGAGSSGMCSLEAFVASQRYARNNGEGDFRECFVSTV